MLGEGEEPAGILYLLYKLSFRVCGRMSWCQKSISETNVSSSSAGTMFGWPTNTSRVIGTGRWGGSLQSLDYHRPVLKGEFIKMDKKHPEASQVHHYQAGNREYTIRLQAYSKFQHPRSRLELWRIRWKSISGRSYINPLWSCHPDMMIKDARR